MGFLMKFLRNWTTLVSIIGVILVFGIVFSGVDAMYVLVVLGAMNCLYGLYSIVTKKPVGKNNLPVQESKNPQQYTQAMGICQLCMGIFVLAMGIIYIKKIVTGEYFWDIIMVGIIIVLVCWYAIRIKARKH